MTPPSVRAVPGLVCACFYGELVAYGAPELDAQRAWVSWTSEQRRRASDARDDLLYQDLARLGPDEFTSGWQHLVATWQCHPEHLKASLDRLYACHVPRELVTGRGGFQAALLRSLASKKAEPS